MAVAAERPFFAGPRVAGLVLTLLVAGAIWVDLPEPIFLVCPLFLVGDRLGEQLFFVQGRVFLLGDFDLELGAGLEVAIFVDLKFVMHCKAHCYKSKILCNYISKTVPYRYYKIS